MGDPYTIFVKSWTTEILIELNLWLKTYVPYILDKIIVLFKEL